MVLLLQETCPVAPCGDNIADYTILMDSSGSICGNQVAVSSESICMDQAAVSSESICMDQAAVITKPSKTPDE